MECAALFYPLYICTATDDRSATSETAFFRVKKKWLLLSYLSFTQSTGREELARKVGLEGRASKKLTFTF